MVDYASRHFLFLQGPHGPFFAQLAHAIAKTGASVRCVGFNKGDEFYWRDKKSYIPFTDAIENWPQKIEELYDQGITDIVLYGDTRPCHSIAVEAAKQRGITVHCFEEGYLRPYWVTYERQGTNGHSKLMNLSVPEICDVVDSSIADSQNVPTQWGALRHHMWYGCVYHWHILYRNKRYKAFRPHRSVSVFEEARANAHRLLTHPWHVLKRRLRTHKLLKSGSVFHLVLLQLGHDSSFLSHSSFSSNREFISFCLDNFSENAPHHHKLIFKAHPLEDGREKLEDFVYDEAKKRGLGDRVEFIYGGKLAGILDHAKTAISVNSTAIQQALFRGLPCKVFGSAIYSKPEFVSNQAIKTFWVAPQTPDLGKYRVFRQFLLESSQVPGGFYTWKGRANVIRKAIDMIFAEHEPYEARVLRDCKNQEQSRKKALDFVKTTG